MMRRFLRRKELKFQKSNEQGVYNVILSIRKKFLDSYGNNIDKSIKYTVESCPHANAHTHTHTPGKIL